MKNWFKFQEKFHQSKISEFKKTDNRYSTNFVLFNIPHETIQPILQIAKFLLSRGKTDERMMFETKKYVEEIKVSYKNLIEIDQKKLHEWIDDPKFDNLMKVTGKQLILELEYNQLKKKILPNVSKYFSINWDKADLALCAQMPGQMFPWHYDRFKSNVFTGVHDKENKVKRWLIMLDDQKPGQVFLMGDQYIKWKKGDVIAWQNVELPHGGGNFGYWPRFSLRITGEILE